ncbi:unnamed protein product [Prunus armeniaca]|uniref:Uncharacterized protein n=1 Tax=Prunus armeniaca TaxID=36596 RepID=A0A6J5V4Z4_PRUAR|nr:unnamed protein product [Prunus armeniaca]
MAYSASGFGTTSLSCQGWQRPNHLGFVNRRFVTMPDDVVGVGFATTSKGDTSFFVKVDGMMIVL